MLMPIVCLVSGDWSRTLQCRTATPRDTYGTGLALVAALVAAGVALTALGWLWRRPWSPLVACHAAPLLHGRRGTWRHLPSFCVAGVTLGQLRPWAGSGGGLGRRWSPVAPRLFCMAGVALGDLPSFCVAAVALGDIHVSWRGRRDTYGTGLALVAALVAAGCLVHRASFAWQAWHLVTSAFLLWHAWRLVTCTRLSCGKRGTYGAGLALVAALVAAGVALGDIRVALAWQAWHLRHWALVAALAAAGVALGDIHVPFVWQAWLYSTGLALVPALVAAGCLVHRASFAWQAWHLVTSVAGVALGDIHVSFVWKEWHLRHWAGSGGGLGRRWSPVAPNLFCVAGVALGDICLRFVWQAWHLVTSMCPSVWQAWHLVTSASLSRGSRGTYGAGLAELEQ
eukprot:s3120_g8.t1